MMKNLFKLSLMAVIAALCVACGKPEEVKADQSAQKALAPPGEKASGGTPAKPTTD